MYLLSDRPILSALEAAKRRGVRVRVMLEEHPYGEGPGNVSAFQRLRAAGILVNWSPADFALSHDKYAVADRRTALIGTANWTASAFASNREYLVLDDDATDVSQLAGIFEADWSRHAVSVDDPRLVVSPTHSRADFVSFIGAARRQIDVESEEMQDQGIEDALAQAAQRGVTVRVIVPAATGADPSAPGKQALKAAGVTLRQVAQPYIHAKDVVVDHQEAFIGSENFSGASLDHNREIGILTVDRSAVDRVEATFARDWAAGS